jgi:hypothetical protein
VPGEVPAEEPALATKCTACGKILTGDEYYLKDGERSCWYTVKGNAYCKKCYPAASEALLNSIEGQPMSTEEPAQERPLMKPACKVCGKILAEDDVFPENGETYCWSHYPSRQEITAELEAATERLAAEKAQAEPAPVTEAPQEEAPAGPQAELPTEPAIEKSPVKRELSEVLQETLEAMGYSEDYIRKVYETAVLELGKIEDKIASWSEKRFAKKELIAEIEEHFSFVRVAKENLSGYVQGKLGLVFDEEPAPEDLPVEPEACAEIAEAAPAEELPELQEPVQEEELSESEKALGELIDALDAEAGNEEDAPF